MNFKGNPLTSRCFMLNAACAATADRPMLQHIYCDGENLVSTNGRILVWTENMEQLEPGFYDLSETGTGRNKAAKLIPFTDPKAQSWTFPNWKIVIPKECPGAKELVFNGGSSRVEQEIFNLQFALASFGTGALIAQEYLNIICKVELCFNVRIVDGCNPVLFECPAAFKFIVMPRRDKGESPTAKLLAQFKDDAIQEWKAARDASEDLPRIAPAEETAPEEPAPEQPQTAPETPAEPEQDAPEITETAKPECKPRRKCKPAFAYVCTLENGEQITLGSVAEVEARGDVVKCNIEPLKKHSAA